MSGFDELVQQPLLNGCGAQVPPWWDGPQAEQSRGQEAYPMDYYAKDGGVWNSSYHKTPARSKKVAPILQQV